MNRVEPNRNVYVGHRYVPLLVGEWDKSIQYEGLSIVTFKGASYTSKKMTPVGIDIENEEYWVLTGNYDAQVEYYRQETERVSDDLAQAKIDLNKRIDDTVQHVNTSVEDLTIYVNDEVRKNSEYVDNSLAENKEYLDDSVNDLNKKIENIIEYNFLEHHNTGDPSDTVKNIIDDAVSKDAFMVSIYFPNGYYTFEENILNENQGIVIEFKGQSRENTRILSRVPTGIFIENNTPNDLKITDIQISGYAVGDLTYFRPHTIGIKSMGNVITNNAYIQGFETIFEWNGGYYHRIKSTRLEKARYIVRKGNANNYVFDDIRALRFDNFFSASTGDGPLVVTNSAIEQWTSNIFMAEDGARPHVIMSGSYIENYPNVEAGMGLAKDYYSGGTVGTGFSSYTFLGNLLSLRGVSRFINNSNIDTKNITSLGNTINYNDDLSIMYVFQNLETSNINDVSRRVGGTNTPLFLSGGFKNPENCIAHNPFTGKDETLKSFREFERTSPEFTVNTQASYPIEFTGLTGVKPGDFVTVIPENFIQPRTLYAISAVEDEKIVIRIGNYGISSLDFNSMNWKIYHYRR